MSVEEEGSPILKSFWAVELTPGKEFTTTPDFDIHLTQAVLPAGANDKARTTVTAKYDDEDEEGNTKAGTAFTIASLRLDHTDSQPIDLIFDADVPVTFTVTGKNPVHLVGFFVPPQNEEPFGDFDSEDEDIDSDQFDEEEEEEEEEAPKKRAAPGGQSTNGAPAAKKIKQEVQQKAQPKEEKKPQQQTPKQGGEKKPQQQQQQKTPQGQKGTLQGGLQFAVLEEGTGKVARKGNRVEVKYVGKLKNGKVFDKATGKPFRFGLGKQEVIQGWDIGVEGMKEGEKRRLVIPSQLAYGAGGAPPTIPPHAELTFDVELVRVM